MTLRHSTKIMIAAIATSLTLAGCTVEGEVTNDGAEPTEAESATPSEASSDVDSAGEVMTGPGVTDSTIGVAILTDLSGPFAAGATVQVTEMRAYWDQVNADGGVCDRTVELDVQDHGYDPQTAVSQYRNIAAETVALQQVLGSPTTAAVLPLAEEDSMYLGGMGWASVVLPSPVAQMPGAPYSIQGANAVDWLMANEGLTEGDTVGVIYFEGDYGSDVLAGVASAAEANGISVIEQPVTPADTDLSSQVAALQRDDAAAVVMGAAPGTLGAYAGAATSAGFTVPVLGANPTFSPSLLETPAGELLQEHYVALNAVSPYASDEPGPSEAKSLYEEAGGPTPGWEVPLAYGQARLLHDALDAACSSGDLTREGVVAAMRSASGLDTGGIFPDELDYSTIGEPPTRQVFISRVNPDVEAGLEVVETYEGPSATAYDFGS